MKIGFDIISDLNLDPDDEFEWEDKATSLYLIIAGNISSDIRVIHQTLLHLTKFYQGVFYIPGSLEYESMHFYKHRNDEIRKICKSLKKVALLERHVVVINNVAILGATGWFGNRTDSGDEIEKLYKHAQNIEDVEYLRSSVEKLQLHVDIKNIVLVTHSVPGLDLFFGELPTNIGEEFQLQECLDPDSENKITHWIYGSYNKIVDTNIDSIHYVNNSSNKTSPYWAKRIEV
jgi:predicted phosphohydrolase